MACKNGHVTVVKLLLDGGSDVNEAKDVSIISWLLVKSECKCPKCEYSQLQRVVRSRLLQDKQPAW